MVTRESQPESLAGLINRGRSGLATSSSGTNQRSNKSPEYTIRNRKLKINSKAKQVATKSGLALKKKGSVIVGLLSNQVKNRKMSTNNRFCSSIMKLLALITILVTIALSILVIAQHSINGSSPTPNNKEEESQFNQPKIFPPPPPDNDPSIVYGRIIQPGTGRRPCFNLPCRPLNRGFIIRDMNQDESTNPDSSDSQAARRKASLNLNNDDGIVYATIDTGARKFTVEPPRPRPPPPTTITTTTTEATTTTTTTTTTHPTEESNGKLVMSPDQSQGEQKENISHHSIVIAPNPIQPDPNYFDNEIAITIDKIKGIEFPLSMMNRLRDNRRRSMSASSTENDKTIGNVKCSVNKYDRLIEREIRNGNLSRPIVHSDGRFDNPFPTWRKQSVMDIIRFMMFENGPGGPRDQQELDTNVPLLKPNFRVNNQIGSGDFRTTWIGHSTLLIQVDGYNILTDPVFSDRASPLQYVGPKRIREPACDIKSLPKIDIVLISHNHYDHLDSNSVKELNDRFGDQCRWIVPLGLGEYLESMSVTNYAELNWWQKDCFYVSNYNAIIKKEFQNRPKVVTSRSSSFVLTKEQKERAMQKNKSELNIYLTPSQHWTRRGLGDVNKSLWGSYTIVSGNGATFFFTGDTAYCKAFKEIGMIFGSFTGAAIPIGAYSPRWFLRTVHVNPQEAVQIHRDIKSNRSIAIHHATFILSKEHYLEPATLLRLEADNLNLKQPFTTIRHGESTEFCKAC